MRMKLFYSIGFVCNHVNWKLILMGDAGEIITNNSYCFLI